MPSFEGRLREHLDALRGVNVSTRTVDERALRSHLLERLRDIADPTTVRRQHAFWSPSRIAELARHLEWQLAHRPTKIPPFDLACRLIDADIGKSASDLPEVDRLEIEQILAGFYETGIAPSYALENRLALLDQHGTLRLTELGRIFLELRGRDAIRWLLTVEVVQSTGATDAWRASRDLLEGARAGLVADLDENDQPYFGFRDETLERMRGLGVFTSLSNGPDEPPFRYGVAPAMLDAVDAVIAGGPWEAAVATALADGRPRILRPASNATEAAIEQTRLVAHEVRNALIPARFRLDASLRAHDDVSLHPVRRGIVRVLAFVDGLVQTSEMLSEPMTEVSLLDVAKEALSYTEGGDLVQVAAPSRDPRVLAPRTRLARAIANIVHNALYASPDPSSVRLTVRERTGTVELVVDDRGPGVPVAEREQIFRDGYTTRPGGTGFGLAFVRKVVESMERGRVWCEDSDLGGARFVLALPAVATSGDGGTLPISARE